VRTRVLEVLALAHLYILCRTPAQYVQICRSHFSSHETHRSLLGWSTNIFLSSNQIQFEYIYIKNNFNCYLPIHLCDILIPSMNYTFPPPSNFGWNLLWFSHLFNNIFIWNCHRVFAFCWVIIGQQYWTFCWSNHWNFWLCLWKLFHGRNLSWQISKHKHDSFTEFELENLNEEDRKKRNRFDENIIPL